MHSVILVLPILLGQHADPPLAPWGANRHPTDVSKRHVERIDAARHVYTIRQGGTMDGTNCRSPIGVGMMDGPAIEQTWESNRAVRLENVGETDVINPWLSNGRNSFRILDEIVSSAVEPGMTDREKAFALWFQEIRHRYHWAGDNNELGDPVKVFNVYGHNTCGNDSICLAGLWKRAGLKVTPARVVGHCVTQAYFDGRWNLFDGDMHSMYLLRDNRTVACEQDLVRDHDLIRRSHTQGILNPDKRANDEWEASIYVFEGKPEGDRNSVTRTTMNMVLRPGEAITWRWGHADPVKYHGENKPRYPDHDLQRTLGIPARLLRRPLEEGRRRDRERSSERWRTDGRGREGRHDRLDRPQPVRLRGRQARDGRQRGEVLAVVGREIVDGSRAGPGQVLPARRAGTLRIPAPLRARRRCSSQAAGHRQRHSDGAARVAGDVGRRQQVRLHRPISRRTEGADHARLGRALRVPAAGSSVGADLPAGRRRGRRHRPRVPLAAREDPDGSRIADYHFELSDRPDMKWPLSTNFYKLISKTADRGKAQYTLPHVGLLAADQKYYWRVRAKNEKGSLGPVERDLELHAARTRDARRRDARHRSDRSVGVLALEAQSGGTEAGEVPHLRQRRKGLLDQRRTVQGRRRRLEGSPRQRGRPISSPRSRRPRRR